MTGSPEIGKADGGWALAADTDSDKEMAELAGQAADRLKMGRSVAAPAEKKLVKIETRCLPAGHTGPVHGRSHEEQADKTGAHGNTGNPDNINADRNKEIWWRLSFLPSFISPSGALFLSSYDMNAYPVPKQLSQICQKVSKDLIFEKQKKVELLWYYIITIDERGCDI